VFVARASRRLERVQWANQTVITRRVDLFGVVAPKLNQLLCFATFVGGWKEIQPIAVIKLKREIDETMYANRVLFSAELFEAYRAFMAAMFAMYAATGADALLRSPIDSKWGDRRKLYWWHENLTALFSTDNPGTMEEIEAAYNQMSQRFRADLYVTDESALLASPP
jgi:hypothetical protein